MEFRVLGPLEVLDREKPVALGAAKERALLALLLIARGEPVPTDRLIEGLWGQRPPATAVKSVHVYVSHLRKTLGDGRIVTSPGGYALTLGPRNLDAARFEERLSAGQQRLEQGDAAAAAKVLRAGLALWRGPPLTDFAYDDFAQNEIARLEELRLSAVEARVEADLALGRHAELVPELEALVAEHPTRERLRGWLMLALYRSGRQADALERFRSGRRELQDRLGLEPGRDLHALHDAILRQDPELEGPAPRRAALRRRRSARWLVAAGLVVIAGAVGTALVLHTRRDDSQLALLGGDTVGVVDPASGLVATALNVPGSPDALAAADGRVWAVADDARTLTSFDASSRRAQSVVPPGGRTSDVAAAARRVWTVDQEHHRLVEIDPAYGQVAGTPVRLPRAPAPGLPDPAGPSPWRLAATAHAVWVTNGLPRLIRVDAATRRVRMIDTKRPLTGVSVAGGAVWALSGPSASVLRVDPRTGRVTDTVHVGRSRPGSPWPTAAAGDSGSLWVLNANTSDLTQIDLRQLRVVGTVPLGVEHQPVGVATGGGAVWVADADGTLARVDRATGDVRLTVVAHQLDDVTFADGHVWLSAGAGAFGPSLPPDARATSARSRPGIAAVAPDRCSPVLYRPGDRPRLLVVSDLPLQTSEFGIQGNTAIELALRDRGYRAGRFAVAYQACADDIANTFRDADAVCAADARAYAHDASVVAVIAQTGSGCVARMLPILNRAPGGPLVAISAVSTSTGLTRAGPGAAPGEPGVYAPTGTPSFVRLTAPDNVQGAADALLASRLGARRVYALSDRGFYGVALAAAFRVAAARLGLDAVGRATWGGGEDRIAERVRNARPGAVFLAGGPAGGGVTMLQALRRVLPASVRILGSDGFRSPSTTTDGQRAAEGLLVSSSGLPNWKLPDAGRRFAARLRAVAGPGADGLGTVGAAQSVDVLLAAIARSDGTRRSVLRELFATRVHDGLLGTFAIAPDGDTTDRSISVYRVTAGTMRYAQTIEPPRALTGG